MMLLSKANIKNDALIRKTRGQKMQLSYEYINQSAGFFFQFIRCKTVQCTSEAKWSFALDITLKIDASVKLETNFKFSVK